MIFRYPLTIQSIILYAFTVPNVNFGLDLCTSTRHVHLSSTPDASTSITISFSSHLCEIEQQGLSHQARDNSGNNNQYSWYQFLKPSVVGVILSTDRDQLTLDENDELGGTNQRARTIYFLNDSDEKTGFTRRYNATTNLRKERFEYWSERQNHIIITDLKPDTKYYYKCIVQAPISDKENRSKIAYDALQDASHEYYEYEEYNRKRKLRVKDQNTNGDEAIFSFKTAPVMNKNSPTKFAILGDLGVFDHSKETLSALAKKSQDIDFIILAGDISYANGQHTIWDKFFDMIDEIKLFTNKVAE